MELECGAGQVHGRTDEARTFATALEGLIDLRLEIAEPWRCRTAILDRHPAATRARINWLQKRAASRDGAVLIVHRDPGRYEHFVKQRGSSSLDDYGYGGGGGYGSDRYGGGGYGGDRYGGYGDPAGDRLRLFGLWLAAAARGGGVDRRRRGARGGR